MTEIETTPIGLETTLPKTGDESKCPKCGADMVLLMARKGYFHGKKFWGCSKYPDCKGTRNNNLGGNPVNYPRYKKHKW